MREKEYPLEDNEQIAFVAFCNNCHSGVSGNLTVIPNAFSEILKNACKNFDIFFKETFFVDILPGRCQQKCKGFKNEHIDKYFTVSRVFPDPPKPNIPDYLPKDVCEIFTTAEYSRLSKETLGSAAPMYRKTLEAAVISLDPSFKEKETFSQRLDKLCSMNTLSEDIKKWISEIRLFGNEAVHNPSYKPAVEEVEEAANCTRMSLVYLFELPTKIAAMRRARDERKESNTVS